MTADSVSTTLQTGMAASYTRAITDADVAIYALITGNEHPLHLNEAYAEATRFGRRTVPAGLLAGLVEAALTRALPGVVGTVGGVALEFPAPAFLDETLTVTMTLTCVVAAECRATCQVVVMNDTLTVARGTVALALEDLPPAPTNDFTGLD